MLASSTKDPLTVLERAIAVLRDVLGCPHCFDGSAGETVNLQNIILVTRLFAEVGVMLASHLREAQHLEDDGNDAIRVEAMRDRVRTLRGLAKCFARRQKEESIHVARVAKMLLQLRKEMET